MPPAVAVNDPHAHDSELVADIITECLSGWVSEKNNATPQQIKKAREIAKKAKNAETARKAVESGGVKSQPSNADIRFSLDKNNGHYDYSKSFAEQIDDLKSGKFAKEQAFILGGTPNIYKKIGLSALPITMEYGHVSDALHGTRDADHTMSEEFLKSILDLLKHPIAIIESDSIKDKSVVAIVKGEINGKQVIAPVQIGKTNTVNNVVIDSNHVATMFGKGNAVTKLFADAVEKEVNGETAVYYWNKAEALPLLRVTGLQLPIRLSSNGLLHSIFDAGCQQKISGTDGNPSIQKLVRQERSQECRRNTKESLPRHGFKFHCV